VGNITAPAGRCPAIFVFWAIAKEAIMICSTTHVYHYNVNSGILRRGLRPLSDMPDHPTYADQEHRFRPRYEELARPLLQRPYANSGVFFTNVDLYRVCTRLRLNKSRIAIPIERLDPGWSVLTYEYDGSRTYLSLTEENMRAAAKLWTRTLVEEWLGADETGWFRYVPQIVTFQSGGVRVTAADIESPAWRTN
jgi:hypothetical protein